MVEARREPAASSVIQFHQAYVWRGAIATAIARPRLPAPGFLWHDGGAGPDAMAKELDAIFDSIAAAAAGQ